MPDPFDRLTVAQQKIDELFGPNFAQQHPQLLITVVQSAASILLNPEVHALRKRIGACQRYFQAQWAISYRHRTWGTTYWSPFGWEFSRSWPIAKFDVPVEQQNHLFVRPDWPCSGHPNFNSSQPNMARIAGAWLNQLSGHSPWCPMVG
jgi:hypothetical protein